MMNDGGHVVLGQACVFVLMVERLMVMGAMVACTGVTGRCMIVGHDGGDGGTVAGRCWFHGGNGDGEGQ